MFRVISGIPSDILKTYVHSYQLVETAFATGYFDLSLSPTVIPTLAFNMGAPKTIYDLQRQYFLNISLILRATKQVNRLRFFPGMRIFLLNFKPDGYYRIFKSASNLSWSSISEQLKKYRHFQQQVYLLEALLAAELEHHQKYCGNISPAIELIYATNGNATMVQLEKESCMTKRTLERHFLQQTGINPKIFSRIVRFRKTMEYISGKAVVKWVELADKFGYYDQKHLRQEFRYFTGLPSTNRSFPGAMQQIFHR